MSPVLQLAVRSGIAAALVMLLMWRRDLFRFTPGTWLPGLCLGLLFSLEYLFLGEGLRYTSASRMVIFLYSAPVFSALVLHLLLPEERLLRTQWVGILMAFAGVALAFAARDSSLTHAGGWGLSRERSWVGDLFGLFAGLAWGLSTVVVRTTALANIPAAQTLLFQLLSAFVALTLAALVLGQHTFELTLPLVWNLLFQALIVAFASFLVWLSLLQRYKASELGVLLFMTPVFGVIFGVLLLNESVHWLFVVAALLVVCGILLVSGRQIIIKRQPL